MKNKIQNADVKEIKKMIDFITENGYKVVVKDFREMTFSHSLNATKVYAYRKDFLMDFLMDIVIYKEDSPENIQEFLTEKYEHLKELLSINDGSIFNSKSVEVCNYAESKEQK